MITSLFIRNRNKKFAVICEYRDEITKKKKQKQLGSFTKKRDANIFLADQKVKLDRGLFVIPKDIILYDYLVTWNDLRKEKISLTTFNYYRDLIKKFNPDNNRDNIGRIKLQDLTPIMVEKFYIDLKKYGLANNTIVKYDKMLRKALGDAKRKQIIYKNVCDYVERIPVKKSTIAKTLNKEQAQKLLNLSIGTAYEIPINLALGLGLRSSEVFGLTWDKIDFKKNTIRIDKVTAIDRATRRVFFKEPKTRTSIRTIVIPKTLSKLLKEYKLRQEPNKYNLVLTTINGEPFCSATFSKNFQYFLESNEFEHIRFHDLRHTNASLHLLAGTSMKVTSQNLGHSTINITADLYTHVLAELNTTAANNIDNILYN